MLKKNISLAVGLAISFGAFAQSEGSPKDGNWIENYLNPNKGSEITRLTDIDEGSRWYYNSRLKGSYSHTYKSNDQVSVDDTYIDGFLRLRGKTMLTDDIGFFGDFWLKAREQVVEKDGNRTNDFTYFDETASPWNHYIFGIESEKLGSLALGKHTATWALFAADIGVQGVMDSQGDAGGKNAGKVFYKNSFDNNLFIHASYDIESEISGLDIGYQTANIYPYVAGAYGVYVSVHNGQPLLNNGNFIVGNANPNSDIKSDSAYNRNKDDLYTYSLSAYKQVEWEHRFAAILAYSEMDDADTADSIKARGYALGGLGVSASVSYSHYPVGFKGFSPVITISNDEFGTTVAPQLDYYFKPYLKVTVAHVMNSDAQDTSKLEFQYDF